jgi:[ribosomal protein S5]-alanine N-acetyltransferase
MELITERLILKPFFPEHINDTYLSALNDPEVMGKTEARHRVWDRDIATDFIRSANQSNSQLFAVFLKSDGRAIGSIRLFEIHAIHKRAELSLLFYDKREWGKGYGTESVKAIVEYGFRDLGLHRIVADYYATNKGSATMFSKAGFEIEGIFKDHFYVGDGKYVDSVRIASVNNNSLI